MSPLLRLLLLLLRFGGRERLVSIVLENSTAKSGCIAKMEILDTETEECVRRGAKKEIFVMKQRFVTKDNSVCCNSTMAIRAYAFLTKKQAMLKFVPGLLVG